MLVLLCLGPGMIVDWLYALRESWSLKLLVVRHYWLVYLTAPHSHRVLPSNVVHTIG